MMAVLAHGVVGRTQVRDVVAGEDVVQRGQEIGADQAGRQFRRGHDDVTVELAGLRAHDRLGGVLVEGRVLCHDLDIGLGFVELLDEGEPGLAAIAFLEPPGQVAHDLPWRRC